MNVHGDRKLDYSIHTEVLNLPSPVSPEEIPHYSSNITLARTVAAYFRKNNFTVEHYPYQHQAKFLNQVFMGDNEFHGESLAETICIGALEFIRSIKNNIAK